MKKYVVTMSYVEYYYLEAKDEKEVEYKITHHEVEPIEEDIPLMEITEVVQEALH